MNFRNLFGSIAILALLVLSACKETPVTQPAPAADFFAPGVGSTFTFAHTQHGSTEAHTDTVRMSGVALFGKTNVIMFGSSSLLRLNCYSGVKNSHGSVVDDYYITGGLIARPLISIESNGDISYIGNTTIAADVDSNYNVLHTDTTETAWFRLPITTVGPHTYTTRYDSATFTNAFVFLNDTLITVGSEHLPAKHILDNMSKQSSPSMPVYSGTLDIYYSAHLKVPIKVVVSYDSVNGSLLSSREAVLTGYSLR